jgi:pimeloyl-ACP methyl ester carboxylesterase
MTEPKATRRQMLQTLGAAVTLPGMLARAPAAEADTRPAASGLNRAVEYGQDTLPSAVRSRRIDNNNGVTMHVLEAGFESPRRPCIVLLHGFPELAYTWRHQLLPLAQAGFHVIAPDLRGCGRSTPAPVTFDDDLLPYSLLSRVSDVVGLVRALGYEKVACVVGHDWGGPPAQWCARLRPDVFQSVVSMSTPFFAAPNLPLGSVEKPARRAASEDINKALAALPRPRKHYSAYKATREANENMWHAPQGVHDMLRAHFHYKSADWPGNRPFALKAWTASELARMPTYYIMDLDKGIAETMAAEMPSKAQIAACKWMTEAELQVYTTEFTRTGFQGGLNWYRVAEDSRYTVRGFAGQTIDVPACYIGGAREWAVYQTPGAFESMGNACTRLLGIHLIEDAGHSLGEEQPQLVNRAILDFLRKAQLA